MLKFAETHEWARLDGQVVTVGITDYAVEQLGDVVFVELPAVGDVVKAGQSFGEIESVKAASELIAPVDGKIIEVNTSLEDDYDVLKDDPFGAAWMIRIEASNTAILETMMEESAYRAANAAE